MKLFFCDVETTGLTERHGIIEIAGCMEIDGDLAMEFAYNVQPFPDDLIEDEALAIGGHTRDSIMLLGEQPSVVFSDITKNVLGKHIDKFDRNDKAYFLAYNSPFDNQMMRSFWTKGGDKYFGSWFWTPDICVMRMAALFFMQHPEATRPANMKLTTVLEHLGLIKPGEAEEAHTAHWDITMTRKLFHWLNAQ